MQITVNIPDEIVAQAEAEGLSAERLVEELVENHSADLQRSIRSRVRTLEAFRASLDAMARHSDKIPILPDEALTRESFYQDHD
jgi:hypothetical protein